MTKQQNDRQTSFFNTTHLEGDELSHERETAEYQEQQILKIFRKEKRGLTPWEVNSLYELYFGDIIIITSARRAITNLTNKGSLIKTDEKKLGNHKKMNYVWKLNTLNEEENTDKTNSESPESKNTEQGEIYEYGAMSSKFSLKAKNKLTAYCVMLLHYGKSNHMVVIYTPESSKEDQWASVDGKISERLDEIFGGEGSLDKYLKENRAEIIECYKTIEKLV